MSMISNALITGGVFSQHIDQRPTQKSPMDRLQDAAAPAAFHNSGDRFDPPKCHPNTRVAVRDKIEKWALRMDPDTRDASILWLSGPAGAGKSAIAQTVAEDFHPKGLLIASFFFGRSDATRNHARSLVATIVYQLYSLLPPLEQSRILAVIERDPLIFTKSLLAQFEALIVNPLQLQNENGFWTSSSAPRLVIIDGLDECLDREMQRNVLRMLSASVHQWRSPIIFLLSSRPEHDIQTMFSTRDFLPIHTRLFLDEAYLPDIDIELFLREEFAECRNSHPFRQTIPLDWPSDEMLKQVVTKSSGQFIYASVVAKYVKSSRHRPHHRLDIVLNIRPASKDLPFSELDALYTHIFSSVDDIKRVLQVISFEIISPGYTGVDEIEEILGLDAGEISILLCDLASVIGYKESIILFNTRCDARQLKIYHASLVDYLVDGARSKEYFVNTTEYLANHIADCFKLLSSTQCQNSWYAARTAMEYIQVRISSQDPTEPIYNAIKGFSISRISKVFRAHSRGPLMVASLLSDFIHHYLPRFFKFLKKANSPKYLELYKQQQLEYDLLLREIFRVWSLNTPTTALFFALAAIHHKLPTGAFQYQFRLYTFSDFINQTAAQDPVNVGETASTFQSSPARSSLECLSDFLCDPTRSESVWSASQAFAEAAKYCLLYLCDHTAFAQNAPSRLLAHQCMRRINTPWMWHRRVLREDIRGPRVTPWLWLRRPTSQGSSPLPCVLHRKTNDLIYIHDSFGIPTDTDLLTVPTGQRHEPDPVVQYRIYSEKYYLALTYLNHFLPRAAKMDDLVDMCQRRTFASRCQNFPRESARARSNMQKYVAQYA